MNDKMLRIILLLMIGWAIGYFHHYEATRLNTEKLQSRIEKLEVKIVELTQRAQEARRVSVKATAYSNDAASINVSQWRDGRTATNKVARRGFVAADWRVFPPGTKLYIPGYGMATVEDRGGAVKGNHLDLYVDSYREAIEWGVREIEVYVIHKANST